MLEIGKDYIKGSCKVKDFKAQIEVLKDLFSKEV
jgi:hypothetical protein